MAENGEHQNGTTKAPAEVVVVPKRRKSDELKIAFVDALVAILHLIARAASARSGDGNGGGH